VLYNENARCAWGTPGRLAGIDEIAFAPKTGAGLRKLPDTGACGTGTLRGTVSHAPFYLNWLLRTEGEDVMSSETGAVDWAAALAEIEAEIATLQATAEVIRGRIGRAGGIAPQPGGGGSRPGGGGGGGVRPDAFLKMSIPDATKKHLENAREKQSTAVLLDVLEKGGLPRPKYNTLYSILARRQRVVGDIINMQGDWALAEWYPNYRPKAKAGKDVENGAVKDADKKATA
jgi:hypothetical protein